MHGFNMNFFSDLSVPSNHPHHPFCINNARLITCLFYPPRLGAWIKLLLVGMYVVSITINDKILTASDVLVNIVLTDIGKLTNPLSYHAI